MMPWNEVDEFTGSKPGLIWWLIRVAVDYALLWIVLAVLALIVWDNNWWLHSRLWLGP